MAIEIKELRIKVTVAENQRESYTAAPESDTVVRKEMISEIVKECTRSVLEIMKERAER
ncbi:DUF5908 family protein [Flavobacterium beibuense]|uniref:DUF5908 family protein n=1 Tax=Flavobacterium beibuense TaxID=657326 RepID=UPI000AAD04CA|nr:DUF5908 family protein [Flavobacterium beibuense]